MENTLMHSKEIYTIITKIFKGLDVDLAIIGAKSTKDLDLFVVNRNPKSFSNISDVLSFIDKLLLLLDINDFEVIVKHEHRNWVNPKNVLHLLYYPSYDHLIAWELPSFIACTYSKGNFLIGSNKRLKPLYTRYRERKVLKSFDIVLYHLFNFMDLALTNLIYLNIKSQIFSKSIYFENLQYVFRYSLRELLISNAPNDLKITFWEKQDLIEYIDNYYPQFSGVAEILRIDVNSSQIQDIPIDQIKLLFIKYLEFCDLKLSADLCRQNINVYPLN